MQAGPCIAVGPFHLVPTVAHLGSHGTGQTSLQEESAAIQQSTHDSAQPLTDDKFTGPLSGLYFVGLVFYGLAPSVFLLVLGLLQIFHSLNFHLGWLHCYKHFHII